MENKMIFKSKLIDMNYFIFLLNLLDIELFNMYSKHNKSKNLINSYQEWWRDWPDESWQQTFLSTVLIPVSSFQ